MAEAHSEGGVDRSEHLAAAEGAVLRADNRDEAYDGLVRDLRVAASLLA